MKCKKNAESKNSKVVKTKREKPMLSGNVQWMAVKIKIYQREQRIQKFKETGDLKYLYQNKLVKACF